MLRFTTWARFQEILLLKIAPRTELSTLITYLLKIAPTLGLFVPAACFRHPSSVWYIKITLVIYARSPARFIHELQWPWTSVNSVFRILYLNNTQMFTGYTLDSKPATATYIPNGSNLINEGVHLAVHLSPNCRSFFYPSRWAHDQRKFRQCASRRFIPGGFLLLGLASNSEFAQGSLMNDDDDSFKGRGAIPLTL